LWVISSDPEFVAILAKDWHGVILTEEGAVYLAAVLEYVTVEILEVSGNNVKLQQSTCMSPRNILFAIKTDPELLETFECLVIREGGSISTKGLRTNLADPEKPSVVIDAVSSELLSKANKQGGIDPLSGFMFTTSPNKELLRSIKEFESLQTRHQRKLGALEGLTPDSRATAEMELPSVATLASLENVDVDSFISRLHWHKSFVTPCIEKIIEDYCNSKGWPEAPTFTHEAMNIFHTAIECYAVEVVYSALWLECKRY
jgi:hypothetical protein